MKYSKVAKRFYLLFLPFLLTGCYTQFQTFDKFPVEDAGYSQYYSWDEYEEGAVTEQKQPENSTYTNKEQEYLDEELALEMDNIYYQDYETKRWYEEHYANKLFWEGYAEGFTDGYQEGWNDHFPYSARYSINRHRFLYGYTGAFNHYSFYHYPSYTSSIWFSYGGFPYVTFYIGYYGGWGYHTPFYNDYWGHPYYAYSYGYAYNSYHKTKKYRNADIYRKGPRSSGLANRGDTRNRSELDRNKNTRVNTRGTSTITRTRSTNPGSRVRGTGSSVGRSSSGTIGRSTSGSRGTSSSVGKGRTNSGTKSRGSGSSVGKRSSSGDSGKSRSRGSGTNLSSSSRYDIGTLGSDGKTYTIPARRVTTKSSKRSESRFSLRDLFAPTNNRGIFNNNSSSTIRIGNTRSSGRSSSNVGVKRSSKSNTTKVIKSSSRSRSSGTKSRSSSSSSKKRSRGGN